MALLGRSWDLASRHIIMVPVWVPIIIRHLLFRAPKRDFNFDNYPFGGILKGIRLEGRF